jgi:hypothetical protein
MISATQHVLGSTGDLCRQAKSFAAPATFFADRRGKAFLEIATFLADRAQDYWHGRCSRERWEIHMMPYVVAAVLLVTLVGSFVAALRRIDG